jgi:hypothetical protein
MLSKGAVTQTDLVDATGVTTVHLNRTQQDCTPRALICI